MSDDRVLVVVTGSYGLPKPWYFPFTRSYWFGHSRPGEPEPGWGCLARLRGRGRGAGLSVMEDDQACAMDSRSGDWGWDGRAGAWCGVGRLGRGAVWAGWGVVRCGRAGARSGTQCHGLAQY